MKKLFMVRRSAFFIFFLLFTGLYSFSEECSVNSMQYKPDGNCDTVKRKCCKRSSGGKWGEWTANGDCKNTPCPSTCPSGQVRDTSVTNEEDGACCKKPTVKAVVKSASAIVYCSQGGGKSYEVCKSYSREREFRNLDDYDSSCSYDSCTGDTNSYVVEGFRVRELGSVYTYECSGSLTSTRCSSSMSDQDICEKYGKGYMCIKSVSGSCGVSYDLYSCGNDWCYREDDIDPDCDSRTTNYDSECHENPLFEETVYVNGLGDATYLSCE